MRNRKQLALLTMPVGILCAGCGTANQTRVASANAASVRPAGSTKAERFRNAEKELSESTERSQKQGKAMEIVPWGCVLAG